MEREAYAVECKMSQVPEFHVEPRYATQMRQLIFCQAFSMNTGTWDSILAFSQSLSDTYFASAVHICVVVVICSDTAEFVSFVSLCGWMFLRDTIPADRVDSPHLPAFFPWSSWIIRATVR